MATRDVPTLDGSGRIFEKHLPSRLGATELSATIGDNVSAFEYASWLPEAQTAPASARVAAGAVRRRRSAPAVVVSIGDSITEGAGATVREKRWQTLVSDSLRATFPTSSAAGKTVAYLPSYYETGAIPDPTRSGGTLVGNMGLGNRAVRFTAVDQYVEWSGVSGTSIDVCYIKEQTGGSLIVSVDGTDAATIDANSGVAFAVDGFRQNIPLSQGTHVIRVRSGSASAATIGGLLVHDGTEAAGITYVDAGHSGQATGHFTGTSGNAAQAQAAMLNPAAVIIALLTNDYRTNIAPATAKANLVNLIGKIKAGASKAPSIVLVTYPQSVGSFTYPWQSYVQVAAEIAASDAHVSHLDLSRLMPSAIEDPDLWPDGVHPTDEGHRRIATAVFGFLRAAIASAPDDTQESIFVPAADLVPMAGATKAELGVGSSTFTHLAFDPASQEGAVAWLQLPPSWQSVTLELLHYSAVTGATGSVRWRVQCAEHATGAAAQSGGFDISANIAMSEKWTLQRDVFGKKTPVNPANLFKVGVIRMATDANDTFTADAGVVGVRVIREA